MVANVVFVFGQVKRVECAAGDVANCLRRRLLLTLITVTTQKLIHPRKTLKCPRELPRTTLLMNFVQVVSDVVTLRARNRRTRFRLLADFSWRNLADALKLGTGRIR